MAVPAVITHAVSSLKVVERAGGGTAVAVGGLTAAGVVCPPWAIVCCAAGLATLAGCAIWAEVQSRKDTAEATEQHHAEARQHSAHLASINGWLTSLTKNKTCQERGLAAAIEEHVKAHPQALNGLPPEVTRDHLTTFLAIIKAEGEAQTRLLEKHDLFVRGASTMVLARLDDITTQLACTHTDIAALINTVSQHRSSLTDILWLLEQRHAPPLLIPAYKTQSVRDRFVFRNRTLDCVGREEEFAELDAWLNDERTFSWDLWTGAAGMGKSRLALELCLKHLDGWQVGFYDWIAGVNPNWATWVPECDTLMVFDYVGLHADHIHQMLHNLKVYPGHRKVRVLLLERPIGWFERPGRDGDDGLSFVTSQAASTGWWKTLENGADTDFRRTHARGLQDDRPDRNLDGLSDENARRMVHEEAKSAGAPVPPEDMKRRLNLIATITPNLRPLYIAMAAEAIRLKNDVIDAQELVRYIKDKENTNHWTPELNKPMPGRGTPDGYRALMALATMCGGLSGTALTACLDDEAFHATTGARMLPTSVEYGDGAVYARLIPDARSDDAPKLEPDLLGECYALGYAHGQPGQAHTMARVALKHDADGLRDFLRRAAMNFPDHPGLDRLFAILPDKSADGIRAAALASLAETPWTDQDWPRVREMGQRALRRAHIGPLEEATAIFCVLSGRPDDDTLGLILQRAQNLAATADDTAVRERLAKGLFNAFINSGTDTVRADRLLDELRALADKHENDTAVRTPLAMGLFNAINGCGTDTVRADQLLDELRALAHQHDDDTAVRERLASGLVNAINNSGTNTARADRLLEELRALARQHDDDTAIRERLAMGLFNAFTGCGSDTERADRLLDELRALADKHENDTAVREQLANGLVNAISHSGTNTVRADQLLDELRALARQHDDDTAVREQLASALVIASLRSEPNSTQAQTVRDEFRSLLRRTPAAGVLVLDRITSEIELHWSMPKPPAGLDHLIEAATQALAEAQPGPGRDALGKALDSAKAAYQRRWP